MSSDPSSVTLPSGNVVLLVLPPIGTAVSTASPVQSLPMYSEAPLTVQISTVLSDIEILPPPPCSSVAVTTAPLACASPLTERALRSQRRDALRALHDVVVTSSPTTVRSHGTLAESAIRAQNSNSCIRPFTPQRKISVYSYSTYATAPRVTTRVADHPPFTVHVASPREFSHLTPLRASRSDMSSTATSATASSKTSAMTAAPAPRTRTASPAHSAPLPLLDISPTPSTDLRANTGSRTGRTPGLRPAAPLPRTFPLSNDGPPPHLVCMAPIWYSLTPLQIAVMERASLNEVETGLAHAQVSDDPAVRAASGQTALVLGTAEHERVAASLRAELATLDHHYTTECHGLQESATAIKEMTRTHMEREARVASFKAQKQSKATALAKAERIQASFLAGLSAQQPAPPLSAAYAAPVAQQPRARAHLTTSVASDARQPPASANLATLVAPLRQPMALGTSTIPTVAAAPRPLGSTVPAPTRPLVPPADALARHTMQPPAPRESRDAPSSKPWSVVVSRPHRHPQPPPHYTPRNARYLELPVSKFMFRNREFPSALRAPKDRATEVHETLLELTRKRFRLDDALDLATKDRTTLSDRVVNATLRLRDLLEEACTTTDGAQWLRDTLRKIEAIRTNRMVSSASDSSATTGQCRREEPSSGRGNAKRATLSGSDSDSGPHPRRTGQNRRQTPPVMFHAAEHESGTPSFPPRVFRPRITQRLPSRAPDSSRVNAPDADPPPILEPDSRGGHGRGNSRR